MTDVNWYAVKELQRKSFHGRAVTPAEHQSCLAAMAADEERYGEQGREVREEYAESLKAGW